MASEKIRNIIKSKVNSAISLARRQVEQYGRGKLDEIKRQIEDPETLIDILTVNADANTCSDSGKDKFNKKIQFLKNRIEKFQKVIDTLIITMDNTKNKLESLIDLLTNSEVSKILASKNSYSPSNNE